MSFASAASSSAVTPVMRTDEESSRRSSSTMSSVSRIACSCWRAMTSSVACGVTFGLPSRSPPIHVPNVSGRASMGSSTPMRASSSSSDSSVCGTAS